MRSRDSGAEFEVRTDADGTFILEGLTPGRWFVRIATRFGTRLLTANHDIDIAEGETLERTFTVSSNLLRDRVVNQQGEPVSNATVLIKAASGDTLRNLGTVYSGEDGTWNKDGLQPGRYTATATPPGRSPVSIQVTIVAHELSQQTTQVE